ncbi:MAG: 4Fe-4S dicluster domain-containing protein [Spirochaetota bacterium]
MGKIKIVAIRHDRCTGCNLCQLVCSFTKARNFNLQESRIRIHENEKEGFFPQICRNCQEPPCLDACPAGAIVRRKEDDYVMLLENKCVGCNMCVMVCPFNAIGQGDGFNYKCDTCDHLENCAQICPFGAIEFITLDKALIQKRRRTADRLTGLAGKHAKW